MDFKRIIDKLHDRVASPSSVKPSSVHQQQRRRSSLGEMKFSKLSKWRGKWENVAKSRMFTNNSKKDFHNTDTSIPSLIHEPTITMSNPTILQRPHSTIIDASQCNCLNQQQQQQHQRPTSCTNMQSTPRTRQSRLSVPYVVDHLRSPPYYDAYSSDDTGSFYNAPLSSPSPPPPSSTPRRFTWYHLTDYNHNDDKDSTSVIDCASSTGCDTQINNDQYPEDGHTPVFVGNQAITTSMVNETSSQHYNDDSTSVDVDPAPAVMPCQDVRLEYRPHYQLATMNVEMTMRAMREKQLELQIGQLRLKNQQLEQQMEDMISGTWTSTTQLIEENDRLESQIRQLQKQQQQQQQRRIKSTPTNGSSSGESYYLDEQEALRHTRAQLGLVEYLEGEPDVMAALNKFKKLLASSC